MRPKTRHEFTIAIICALSIEAEPVEELFDEVYDRRGAIYSKQRGDPNIYVTGKIGTHDVVLSYMPGIGRAAAASVAASLRMSYTGIQLGLVVGICGATPTLKGQQIFLGDVIMSDSVTQYDFGRQYPGGFNERPTPSHGELKETTIRNLQSLKQVTNEWQRPSSDDILFAPQFVHKHYQKEPSATCICFSRDRPDDICSVATETTCSRLGCDQSRVIRRRGPDTPMGDISFFIGKIASADTVMKSGVDRDKLAESDGVIGFEMEGAGVWDNMPCIVIKGVCDYADSHKSKDWQRYAAATGASAAKAFLYMWNPVPRDVSSFSSIRKQIDKGDPTCRIKTDQIGLLPQSGLAERYSNEDRSNEVWKTCVNSKDVQDVQTWLSNKQDWLLIFDNYRPPVDLSLDEGGPVLERFFSREKRGHILITTQLPLTAPWHFIRLGKVDREDEATEILLSQGPHHQDISSDPVLKDLVTRMDGHPLALASAGIYLFKNKKKSCSDYLRLYSKAWLQLQRDTPQLPSYRGDLHSCWFNIAEYLFKSRELSMILLNWTCLDSQDIWFELIDGPNTLPILNGSNRMTIFNQAMSLLCDYGLVDISSQRKQGVGSQGYNLQRSFHAWLESYFVSLNDPLQNSLEVALCNVINCSRDLVRSDEYYEEILRLLPHANRCYDLVSSEKIHLWRADATQNTLYKDIRSREELGILFEHAGYKGS
ncbi:hypothetical protein PENSTE_c026G03003 [Penicillium steckii]|uniref:Nucleoside phosphorylase domain-containing protein n=1 Tax=Penicillium steckii TaxID=303698 RepID=A0A1V6SQD7_9EURO|nr:hypothetical protein PENSTE_c026G03003 [Penicillium steckii]